MSEVETARATMRAWAIDAYDGPERMQIRRLPVPEPGPGDVLIGMFGAEVRDAYEEAIKDAIEHSAQVRY